MQITKPRLSASKLSLSSYLIPDLILICLLSAIMIFFRLGSTDMPQTEYTMSADDSTREIVLELGDYKELSAISFFVGHSPASGIVLSYYDENRQQWNVIENEQQPGSALCWNTISLTGQVKYLGIVETEGSAIFHELVLLDPNGNNILPVNASSYPALFDEQDLRPLNPTYLDGTYFDEVYYATTAYQLRHGIYPIEITHPHLGKYLITLGTMIMGFHPFGWRFMVALFGVLLNIPFYLLAQKMTGKRIWGFFAVLLLNLDCMHYTLARICTIDTIVAFFILCFFCAMYYLLCRIQEDYAAGVNALPPKTRNLILCSAFFCACAVTTKWTGVYAAIAAAILFLFRYIFHVPDESITKQSDYRKQLFLWTGLSHFGITLVMYLLSYIPFAKLSGRNFLTEAYEVNKLALDYHSTLVATHTYSSVWYQWIFSGGTLLDAFNGIENGKLSEISTCSNPVICLIGIGALVLLLSLTFKKKDKNAGFLVFLYFGMLLPWMAVSRLQFNYQFYVPGLLLCLILTYAFSFVPKEKRYITYIFIGAAALVFLYVFPVISGYPITYEKLQQIQKTLPWWRLT